MRNTTIPAQTVTEDISSLDEVVGYQVRFLVGKKDSDGNWITGQQFETFVVSGSVYEELNGPPLSWCPDKPTGTYRNEDLWHYVDLQRKT